MAPLNTKTINNDEAQALRFLIATYILGAVDFLHQVEELSYGQFRFLYSEVLTRAGWPADACGTIFDISSGLPDSLPEIKQGVEEAMNAGANAFREFYADHDTTAPLRLAMYVAKWTKEGYANRRLRGLKIVP